MHSQATAPHFLTAGQALSKNFSDATNTEDLELAIANLPSQLMSKICTLVDETKQTAEEVGGDSEDSPFAVHIPRHEYDACELTQIKQHWFTLNDATFALDITPHPEFDRLLNNLQRRVLYVLRAVFVPNGYQVYLVDTLNRKDLVARRSIYVSWGSRYDLLKKHQS